MRPESETERRDSPEVQVAKITAKQVIIVTTITAIAGLAGAVLQSLLGRSERGVSQTQYEELQQENKALKQQLEAKQTLQSTPSSGSVPGLSTAERNALYLLTADRVESSF